MESKHTLNLDAQIIQRCSLWQNLQQETRPIVIYGMGDGAEKILAACESYNIPIAEVFASDAYVRGHSFRGYLVKKLSQIEAEYPDFVILLAFAVHTKEGVAEMFNLSKKHTLFAPDLPVCGGEPFTFDFYWENRHRFASVYSRLADEESRAVYANMINFKISGKLEYLLPHTNPEEDMMELLHLTHSEDYLDLGAYDGDTIRQLIAVTGGYNSIVALEPDPKNFKKLTKFCGELPHCTLYPKGSYSTDTTLQFDTSGSRNSSLTTEGKKAVEVVACDHLPECKAGISYIKMDVEGAEEETLKGCRNIIATYKPSLNISAYHRNDDLFILPETIWEMCSDYRLYCRKHRYIPAWEILFYAIANG